MEAITATAGEPFAIEIWGDAALFSRPELSVERWSYDVPTPAALSGLVKAIYWHPGLEIAIDRIHVVNPIRRQAVRVNEVGEKMSTALGFEAARNRRRPRGIDVTAVRQQRTNVILRDVRYVVEGRVVEDPAAAVAGDVKKGVEILRRRVRKGQCYRMPCLGCREFAANWKPADLGNLPKSAYEGTGAVDLGIMRHSSDFKADGAIVPRWFHAVMVDGVIDVAGSEVL